MSRSKTILLVAFALAIGGLVGGGMTTCHLRNKRRGEISMHVFLSSRALLDQISLLDKSETGEVRQQLESELANNIMTAETFSSRNDTAGEISKNTLKLVASHRTNPVYIQQEAALKQMLNRFNNVSK